MKCKVVSAEKDKKDIKYPCLMIAKDGEVVLFTDERIGFCVVPNKNILGENHDGQNFWDMSCFTYDPNLTIELTNKE